LGIFDVMAKIVFVSSLNKINFSLDKISLYKTLLEEVPKPLQDIY